MNFSKIVINYMVKYLSAFLLIFLTSVIIFKVAKNSIEDYVVDQAQMQVNKGVTSVIETIEKMSLISQLLYTNEDFQTLIWQKEPLSSQNLLTMRSTNELILQISSVSDYIPYMFVLFDKNDICLSNHQCAKSFRDYYGTFISASLPEREITDADQMRSFLFDNHKKYNSFHKLKSFHYTRQVDTPKRMRLEDALIYLTTGDLNPRSSSHIFCFVMSKEQLVESILIPEMTQDSFLYIRDCSNDEELLSYGEVPEQIQSSSAEAGPLSMDAFDGYYTTELVLDSPNWQIITGFSTSYINTQLAPIQQVLMIYLALGLAAVVLLTLYLSLSRYYGLRKVFLTIPAEEMMLPSQNKFNEYKLLSHNIANLDAKRKAYSLQMDMLTRQNQAILLENLITRSDFMNRKREFFEQLLGKEPEFYNVVTVRYFHTPNKHDINESTLDMLEFLMQKKIPLLGNVHSGLSDELFIIELSPLQEDNMMPLVPIFKEMAKRISEKYDCILHVGISSIGTGFSNINVCYEQTRQIVQSLALYENETIVQAYDITANSLQENPVTLEYLNRLHTILVCGRYADAEKELQQLKQFYTRMPYLYETQRELSFYSLKNLFYTVMLYLNCQDMEHHIPMFTPTISCSEMIQAFLESASWICDMISFRKKNNNDNLAEKILEYLNANYQNSELSLTLVSKEVGISENYICQLLKSQTGETFSTHLLQIRLKKALAYLEHTNYSNKEIAALTGFASANTFYRNFQKAMGVSPKFYKESLNEK